MSQFLVVKTFYLYQILVAFACFALEIWVSQSGPALMCLCPLLLIQSGTWSQDVGLVTLDTGPCLCALLFSV